MGKCLERAVFQVPERHPAAKTAGYHVPTFPAAALPPLSLAVVLCTLPKCGQCSSGRSSGPRQHPGYLSGTCNVQIQCVTGHNPPQPALLPSPGVQAPSGHSGPGHPHLKAFGPPAGFCLGLSGWLLLVLDALAQMSPRRLPPATPSLFTPLLITIRVYPADLSVPGRVLCYLSPPEWKIPESRGGLSFPPQPCPQPQPRPLPAPPPRGAWETHTKLSLGAPCQVP